MKTARWVIAIVLLVTSAAVGTMNLFLERTDRRTPLQLTVYLGVGLYAVLGWIGAYALARRRRWAFGVALGWAVTVVYVASVASIAWMDAETPFSAKITALLGAALVTAAIAALVPWSARKDTREQNLPKAGEATHIPPS